MCNKYHYTQNIFIFNKCNKYYIINKIISVATKYVLY